MGKGFDLQESFFCFPCRADWRFTLNSLDIPPPLNQNFQERHRDTIQPFSPELSLTVPYWIFSQMLERFDESFLKDLVNCPKEDQPEPQNLGRERLKGGKENGERKNSSRHRVRSFRRLIRRPKNMLSLECRTGLAPEKVLEELKRSFGKGGLGLEVKEENPQCITFEGGGGYVTATLCQEKGKTRVDLVTQEWDYQVKQFASKIK
jgi:hypothetical protein